MRPRFKKGELVNINLDGHSMGLVRRVPDGVFSDIQYVIADDTCPVGFTINEEYLEKVEETYGIEKIHEEYKEKFECIDVVDYCPYNYSPNRMIREYSFVNTADFNPRNCKFMIGFNRLAVIPYFTVFFKAKKRCNTVSHVKLLKPEYMEFENNHIMSKTERIVLNDFMHSTAHIRIIKACISNFELCKMTWLNLHPDICCEHPIFADEEIPDFKNITMSEREE